MRCSFTSWTTRTSCMSWQDTSLIATLKFCLYNDIQLQQLLLYIISLKCITFTTWQLVRLVRVAPLQSSISRLEQVVSIGQPSKGCYPFALDRSLSFLTCKWHQPAGTPNIGTMYFVTFANTGETAKTTHCSAPSSCVRSIGVWLELSNSTAVIGYPHDHAPIGITNRWAFCYRYDYNNNYKNNNTNYKNKKIDLPTSFSLETSKTVSPSFEKRLTSSL